MRAFSNIILLIAASCFSASFAFADTITVCLDGTCDFTDPAEAAKVLLSGDTLEIAAGTYLLEEPLSLYGVNAHVRGAVDSGGNPATILDAQGMTQVFASASATGESVIENLVMTHGYADYGGGIFISGSGLIFRNCHIRDNHAGFQGGAMFLTNGASLTLIDCKITGNIAEHPKWDDNGRGGAFWISNSTLFLIDSQVTDNFAVTGAGGIGSSATGAVVLERSSVCGNVAPGAAQVSGGTVTILGGCIEVDCDSCVTTEPADLNFDGSINVTDLLLLIDMWGGTGSADIDSNGVVDVSDLLILIGSWS